MSVKQPWAYAAAFLVLAGSVCSGQATRAESEAPNSADPTTPNVTVTDYDTVSLNVQNTDLAQVLQLLSIQSRRNIVPSPQVNGSVTANLYDVTFDEALDAILQQNGCGYKQKGNFIYVYTLDQLRKIEEAERRLTHRVFKLNYVTAEDASTFVTPLLSSAGSIAITGTPAPGFQPSLSDGGANSNVHGDTMVVRDYPENVDEIAKVIAQLDERPRQVLVEATILKADVTENMAFGVDFSVLLNIGVDLFTNPLTPVTQLINGTVKPSDPGGAITSTVGNVSEGSGGLRMGVVTDNVSAFIRALDSVTDTTVLANPKLLVLNRQRADVLVGEKIGYLSTTATSTATTQTVEFLDTGTQLTVRPFVSEDGYIRMELKPQVSTARIRDVVPGTSQAAVTIPDEITQELTTNIMVRDGETVVLGGLFKEETKIGREQIPLLGDIPIAGYAFKGRDDELKRFEVVFLITPHIVRENALYAAGKATMDGVEMVRIGAREHLLPWSRSKMSAGHIRQALEALEARDRDTALWEIDLALGLDPSAIEALRLKEKLTGQRVYWPGRSMLDEAVNMMVEDATNSRGQDRARPMKPDPRPAEPSSDGEPLVAPAPAAVSVVEPAPAPVSTPAPATVTAESTSVYISPAPAPEAATVTEPEAIEVEVEDVPVAPAAPQAAEAPATGPAVQVSAAPIVTGQANIVTSSGDSSVQAEPIAETTIDEQTNGAAGEPMTDSQETDGAERGEMTAETTDAPTDAAPATAETTEPEASEPSLAEAEAAPAPQAEPRSAFSSMLRKAVEVYYGEQPAGATTSVDPASEEPVK